MSVRPVGLIVSDNEGVYTVIDDDPKADTVLLIPGSFNHRLVIRRDDMPGFGEFEEARPRPFGTYMFRAGLVMGWGSALLAWLVSTFA